MPDQNDLSTRNSVNKPAPLKVSPTLFIGLGGTGKEIALRVRRRILNYVWGPIEKPVRIGNLTEFPVAQFIHFDLDNTATKEKDKAVAADPLSNLVKFTDEERIVFPLDTDKYFCTNSELNRHPHILKWFPFTRKKFVDLGIHPEEGAGQIRALSRLYFFDKYDDTRGLIERKIDALRAGVDNTDKMGRLHLNLDAKRLRVVVITSIAGGTGSGSFLDMGYLAKKLAKEKASGADVRVDLMLMLPSGYAAYNRSRTEANAYAALMELETCMLHDLKYVEGWGLNENFKDGQGQGKPYNDVFLFDTGNLALKKTENATNVFDMVADILFEDFTSEEFAMTKRSIAPNISAQHKSGYESPQVDQKYGSMKLMYSKAYSSFGQAIIDTQLEQKRDEIACAQVNDMLKVFFGIASDSVNGRIVPPPTPDEGRNILKTYIHCTKDIFEITYDFISNESSFKKGEQLTVHELINRLLYKDGKPILGRFETNINHEIEEILTIEKDQRLSRLDKFCGQLDRDLGIEGRASDGGARGEEEAICDCRKKLFESLIDEDSKLLDALWNEVDDKKKGGLDYTIRLIERIKDEIENDKTGILRDIENNQKKFANLCDTLRSRELQVLRERYGQAKGKSLFGGNKDAYAEAILRQMGETIRWYAGAQLRALACREAMILLKDLSSWLGQHQGIDERTNRKRWSPDSFAGKLADYEKMVADIMSTMNEEIIRIREATKQGHAAYQIIEASSDDLDAARNIAPEKAMEWAELVFKNLKGSRRIFRELENDIGRAKLIGQLRDMALYQLPKLKHGKDNPLFKAFKDLGEDGVIKLFQNCLEMSIPWVEANLGGNWKVTSEQYYCIIGVDGVDTFRAEGYNDKLIVPTSTKLAANKIDLLQTSVPGKLTCYVELSGIPIFALNQLSNWRTSYTKESKERPVHTHKDKTLFVHPEFPSNDALDRLAEDFKLYIQGIIFGVLRPREDGPGDIVYLVTNKGEQLSIGNERHIRMDGVPPDHQFNLKEKVKKVFERIKTPIQFAGLLVLYDFYTKRVYPSATIRQEGRDDTKEHGFGNVMCITLRDEVWKTLKKKQTIQHVDIKKIFDFLIENENIWIDSNAIGRYEDIEGQKILEALTDMDKWTDEIKGSEFDVNKKEFGESEYLPKRILKPEFFTEGWFDKYILPPENRCPKCGKPIEEGMEICPDCQQSKCPHPDCGKPIKEGMKICPYCKRPIITVLKCPYPDCGKSIKEGMKICPFCKRRLQSKCPACSNDIEKDWDICPYCETSLKN